jgi:Zn finger protein HypA/HybF involved in hydrogenase expression
MQKVGDVCENCRSRWESKDREPKVLQKAKGTTEEKKAVVPICPYCDGDAVKIAKAA